jgi:hypothetical protein
MTDEEERHVRAIARWFYGEEPDTVNDEVASVLGTMLQKTLEGSRAMHLVPRPTGGPPGLAWLMSQAVRSWWSYHHSEKVYETVKRTIAWSYRSQYRMAVLGL